MRASDSSSRLMLGSSMPLEADAETGLKIIENLQDDDEDIMTDAVIRSDEEEIVDYSNYTPTEPKEEDELASDADDDLVDEDSLYQ